MNGQEFLKLLKEHKENRIILKDKDEADFERLTEGKFPIGGFGKFFAVKLKKTGYYDDAAEIKAEVTHAIDNMKYDMKQGDSLFKAFERACDDLHIESDGIESYL